MGDGISDTKPREDYLSAERDKQVKADALHEKVDTLIRRREEARNEPARPYGPANVKDPYNPKDAVGVRKWRQYTVVPCTVTWALGVALLEGARKYGRHNYRAAPVRASVYVDAAKGHIDSFWEGEDIDEESGLSHIVKAMASLTVLYDAMVQKKWVDDRPPATNMAAFKAEMQKAVDEVFKRIPEAKPAFTETDNPSGNKGSK